MIEDDDLLEKHNNIWDKVSVGIEKEFDIDLVCNKSFWKSDKSYGIKVAHFYDKEIPMVNSIHTYLAVINLDSAI